MLESAGIAHLLALALQAAVPGASTALPPAAAPAQEGSQVVVVGRSLSDSRAALDACLARHCSPLDDMAAATAHAQNQFLAGDYDGAGQTLGKARSRNKRFARQLPVPVSNLLAFQAGVMQLVGLADTGRIGTIDSLSALRAGLPTDDPRIALQQITVADAFARQGRFFAAVAMYDGIARHATAAHWREVQGRALFGAAMLYATAASVNPAFDAEAKRRIAAVTATTDPALRPYREATVVLRGRLASMSGNGKQLNAVLAEAATMRTSTAMLIYAPAIDLSEIMQTGSAQLPANFRTRDQWFDVGFRIAPDGSVQDVVVERSGSGAYGRWIEIVKATVARRRYLPLDISADAPGLARLERYSLVSDVGTTTGTRIRTHLGAPRVQITDLTPDNSGRATAKLP